MAPACGQRALGEKRSEAVARPSDRPQRRIHAIGKSAARGRDRERRKLHRQEPGDGVASGRRRLRVSCEVAGRNRSVDDKEGERVAHGILGRRALGGKPDQHRREQRHSRATRDLSISRSSPRWRTAKVCPAIVSVPFRSSSSRFSATLNVTDPLPLPLAPEVTVIHDALLVAVHPHPLGAETDTPIPPPPDASNVTLEGEMV